MKAKDRLGFRAWNDVTRRGLCGAFILEMERPGSWERVNSPGAQSYASTELLQGDLSPSECLVFSLGPRNRIGICFGNS